MQGSHCEVKEIAWSLRGEKATSSNEITMYMSIYTTEYKVPKSESI